MMVTVAMGRRDLPQRFRLHPSQPDEFKRFILPEQMTTIDQRWWSVALDQNAVAVEPATLDKGEFSRKFQEMSTVGGR